MANVNTLINSIKSALVQACKWLLVTSKLLLLKYAWFQYLNFTLVASNLYVSYSKHVHANKSVMERLDNSIFIYHLWWVAMYLIRWTVNTETTNKSLDLQGDKCVLTFKYCKILVASRFKH